MLYHQVLVSTALFAAGTQATFQNAAPHVKRQAPEGMVTVQTVQVGDLEGNNKFWPESVQADPGTMVQFQFYPQNHSVVQSTFDNPCEPINNIMPDMPGVGSGFMSVESGAPEMPVWSIMINDTNPMWLYCGQPGHCENGMVMTINVPEGSENTLEQFKEKAAVFNREGTGNDEGQGPGQGGQGQEPGQEPGQEGEGEEGEGEEGEGEEGEGEEGEGEEGEGQDGVGLGTAPGDESAGPDVPIETAPPAATSPPAPPVPTGTGGLPTMSGSWTTSGAVPPVTTPRIPPSNTVEAPAEATDNAAPRSAGDITAYLALFVAAFAMVAL